jgi:transposase
MPQDIYAELRVLSNSRVSLMKRYNALKNTITAVMDEYFPEIKAFKNPLILSLSFTNTTCRDKKGFKNSIGVGYGIASAKLKLGLMIEELELLTKQLEHLETAMEVALAETIVL